MSKARCPHYKFRAFGIDGGFRLRCTLCNLETANTRPSPIEAFLFRRADWEDAEAELKAAEKAKGVGR